MFTYSMNQHHVLSCTETNYLFGFCCWYAHCYDILHMLLQQRCHFLRKTLQSVIQQKLGDRKTNPQYNVNYSGNIHRQLGPSSFIYNWQSVINHCITFAKTTCHIAVRALFIKRSDILPPNLMKSRCREIGCYNELVVLEFDRHLGSSAAEVPVKFPSE